MTAFWAILIAGIVLASFGKLTDSFAGFAVGIHAFIVGRAISEDKYLQGKAPPDAAPSAPAAG